MPDQAVVAHKAHEAAAVCAGGELLAVAPVDEDPDGFADVGAVLFLGNTVLHRDEAVKAAAVKNVNASGLLSVQNIQTGYDPVTGSVTPKVLRACPRAERK